MRSQLSAPPADNALVVLSISTRAYGDEQGFSLIEILVAMLILITGVLGTVALIDGANASTSQTKARVGATNLARELAENARAGDYDLLTTASLPTTLMAKPSLADNDSAASGWQIKRRGISYTVVATACKFDDQTDNTAAHDATFCSNSPTSPAGDVNPDDYRRVTFDVSWSSRGQLGSLSQSVLVINPSGGLGPRIVGAINGPDTVDGTAGATVDYSLTTTSAASVRWFADDGATEGNATGGPTSWSFTWQLGSIAAAACPNNPSWVVDGAYILTVQARDSLGIPGDLKTKTVSVDRSAPAPPCGLRGGRNGAIFDLEWSPNPERDIQGYEVYRRGGSSDTQVCNLTTKTECIDTDPPPLTNSSVTYYVVAIDGGGRTGQSADASFPQGSNQAPSPPPQVTGSIVAGQPVLAWTAASDTDGTIAFYRIYRDGTALANRHGATNGPQLTFTDKTASGHQYWVSAVDNQYAESLPVGPVSP